MKRWLLPLVVALPCAALAMAPPPDRAPTVEAGWPTIDGMPVRADRLLIRLKPEALAGRASRPAALAELPGLAGRLAGLGAVGGRPLSGATVEDAVARAEGLDRDYVVELAPGEDPAARLADWAARPEVEWAEPDWIAHAMVIPADTYFSQQWALRNTGQSPGNGTPDVDIDAEQAWDLCTGSTDVTIAIIDTGADLNHPDLAAKIVAGYDFVNDDSTPDDDHMHGTACSSLAAAVTNNGTGVSGVDWLARIMPLKVLASNGYGSTTDIIAAVNWARSNGADVISMSLGGGGYSNSFNSAINAAFNAGVVVVSAAGNANASSIDYPAAYGNSMAVGALSPCNERKSPSSCDGETWWGSNYGTGLDVMAPGVHLRSATINSYINDMNGTSGATPHVAGVAALIKARNPSLSAGEIRDIIRNSAVDMGAAGWDTQTGYGRLNAYEALLLTPVADPCAVDADGPAIVHVPLPDLQDETLPAPVSAEATDPCGVDGLTLSWQVNGGSWSESAMQDGGDGLWSGVLPAQAYGSLVHYRIVAVDGSANANESVADHSYSVIDPCQTDQTPPTLALLSAIADTDDGAGPYVGLVQVGDPCGLALLVTGYTVDGGPSLPASIQPIGGDQYAVLVPGVPAGGFVEWSVLAVDDTPQSNQVSGTWSFTVAPADPCASDDTPPTLELLAAIPDGHDVLGPWTATVSVADDCGIASVEAGWSVDGEAQAAAPLVTPLGDGEYAVELPAVDVPFDVQVLVEWWVLAVDGSPAANEIFGAWTFTATPTPGAPAVAIEWIGGGQVRLSWPAVPYASSYRVESAPALGAPFGEVAVVAGLEHVTTAGADAGRIFRVVALD